MFESMTITDEGSACARRIENDSRSLLRVCHATVQHARTSATVAAAAVLNITPLSCQPSSLHHCRVDVNRNLVILSLMEGAR